jgi:uridine kinase
MYFICIIGPVGSGKTTFTERLLQFLNSAQCCVISVEERNKLASAQVVSCDNYFLSNQENYDVPEALNVELLKTHIASLRNNQIVYNAPCYSFENHTCTYDLTLNPCEYIFVEGHMNLCLFTKNDFDLVVYIDQSDESCFQRRLLRDTSIREHRSVFDVSLQHFQFTLPAQKKYVEPQKFQADVIVKNFEHFVVLCYLLCLYKK